MRSPKDLSSALHRPELLAPGGTLPAAELAARPWQPVAPGFSLKVLRGGADTDTRALLLRLEPGTVIARHRHSGEVHSLTLEGRRRLLESGVEIGPGGYVYEPAGNVDSWMAVGEEPVVVFVTARGEMTYLEEGGPARSTTSSVTEAYREYLARHVATAGQTRA